MSFSTIFKNTIYTPPSSQQELAEARLNEWITATSITPDAPTKALLLSLFGNSEYLSSLLKKEADFFISLISLDSETAGFNESFECIITTINNARYTSQEQIMRALRVAKCRISLLIAIADITKTWELEEVTWKLSIFAETCVQATCRFLMLDAHKHKEIILQDTQTPDVGSGLVVVAMGKLGAFELNYSSDIDIIIFYEEGRINYIGRHSEARFFIKIAQNLSVIMQERTQDGYVFRTDLRLRPDPGATPIAVSLKSAEKYYETLGQNWERAAMIKARTIAGDAESCVKFSDFIKPYVWRRELDFDSIKDIHSIKRQIDAKHGNIPDDLYNYNVKLGHGGIREIEFFVQTQQLIYGGRRPNLRTSSTCTALQELVASGEISQTVCDDLTNAYRCHRTLEHRLQMVEDQQTHTLPDNLKKMTSIAYFMGYHDVDAFISHLLAIIRMVKGHYAELFDSSPSLAMNMDDSYGNLVFTGSENDPETVKTLKNLGFKNSDTMAATIRGWHHGRRKATESLQAREALTEIMPVLLVELSKTANPDTAFTKFDMFIDNIPDNVQLFSLYYSNPRLLTLIADIMGSYPQIADDLTHYPTLLDYVLAPEFYSSFPDRKRMKETLHAVFAEEHADLNSILSAARYWTNDRRFRVAIQFIENKITNNEAVRILSRIADVVLEVLLEEVTREFEHRHGKIEDAKFAIIALGKLGGKELSFGSDLDIVFIYDTLKVNMESNGKTPLVASQYFSRLSKQFLNALTQLSPEGSLYEVDIRLRPSGDDGPVASSFTAFDKYYGNESNKGAAWEWEFMALTRARVVTGSPSFRYKIMSTVREKLIQHRDHEKLTKGVLHIHQKLKESKYSDNPFAIKTVEGGLMDLEYIVQYLQLRYSHEKPEILHHNTLKSLQAIGNVDIIERTYVKELIEAERIYSRAQTAIRLTQIDITGDDALPIAVQKTLSTHTHVKDFKELKKKLVSTQKNVQKLLKLVIK